MYSCHDFERLFVRYKLEGALPVFRLRNSACRISLLITYLPMVQGYAKEDNTVRVLGVPSPIG